MKVIIPSYIIMTDLSNSLNLLKQIEIAGRVCYKSEDKITESSCLTFCQMLINRGHEAMLEHSSFTVKFTIDRAIANELVRHRIASYAQESTRYCIAGDTQLKFSNSRLKMTIRELYDNKINSKNGSWKRLKIRQIDDNGTLRYGYIDDVFLVGRKPVYEITTKLGYHLKCTSDHEIYTSDGYKKLSSLGIGSLVYVNGITINEDKLYKSYDWLYHQSITLNKTFKDIATEFNFNVSTLKKWAKALNLPKKPLSYFNKGRVPWNKSLSEKDSISVKKQAEALRKYHHCGRCVDKILKEDTSEYQKYNTGKCSICGVDDIVLDVHHIDEDRSNNNPSNLITLCRSHHLMLHNRNLDIITLDEIVSIKECGEEDVYDISMKQYHNFVANGVIVHNCNYDKNKFGNEIKVIKPEAFEEGTYEFDIWWSACKYAEDSYMALIKNEVKPELARDVLPLSLATEIVCTANIREWRNIFKLRSSHNIFAHPQMRSIMDRLVNELKAKIPVLFDDIEIPNA